MPGIIHPTELINSDQKVNSSKGDIHYHIIRQQSKPVVFPGSGDKPVIEKEIAKEASRFSLYIIGSIEVD